jgi:hypothetical protein
MKKAATKAERAYMGRVAELGCIVCQFTLAQVHHIREGQGMSQRASHYLTIPLCPEHHMGVFSIHNSPEQFKNIYGSELNLLSETIGLLNERL